LAAIGAMGAGCTQDPPPASLATSISDSSGVQVITLDRPLADVAAGRAGAANLVGTRLFVIDSLTHPVAVTFLASGEVAVVDRNDKRVVIVDSLGILRDSLGRPGEGPGEFGLPAGIVALGDELVVLQSRPTNTLTRLFRDGPASTTRPPIPGDWTGWFWHRPDISLEYPGQSAPEVWSRRIRAFDDSTFLVFVGPVGTDTNAMALARLLRFRRDLSLIGALDSFPTVRRELRVSGDPRAIPQPYQEVWAPRMVWGAGGGRIARGWGGSSRVEIRGTGDRVVSVVQWPVAAAPVTQEDKRSFLDGVIRVTLAATPGAAETKARTSEEELEAQLELFLAGFDFAPTRPELVSLFVSEGCLWLAGFDPKDDADGASHEWVVVDLTRPNTPPQVATIGDVTERVVAIERGRAATIRLDDDGFRRVTVYQVTTCGAAPHARVSATESSLPASMP
jgi:hypothetical protein